MVWSIPLTATPPYIFMAWYQFISYLHTMYFVLSPHWIPDS